MSEQTPAVQPDRIEHPVKYAKPADQVELDANGEAIVEEGQEVEGEKPIVNTIDAPEPEVEDDPMRPAAIPQETWANLQATVDQKGELDEEGYAILKDLGFSKTLVDSYIANSLVAYDKQESDLYAPFGGREKWDGEVASWAASHLTQAQRDAFNAKVSSGNMADIAAGMAEVAKLHEEALGSEASVDVAGKRPSTQSGVKPFASSSDYQRAIGDPRWLVDSEYTQNVRKRWTLNKRRGDTINS